MTIRRLGLPEIGCFFCLGLSGVTAGVLYPEVVGVDNLSSRVSLRRLAKLFREPICPEPAEFGVLSAEESELLSFLMIMLFGNSSL